MGTPPWSPLSHVAGSLRVADFSDLKIRPPNRYFSDKMEELEEIALHRSDEDLEGGVKNKKRSRSGASRSLKRQKIESKSARRGGGGMGRDPYKHDKEHQSDLGSSERDLEIATGG